MKKKLVLRAKRHRTRAPITLTLKITTIERLRERIERGSWSGFIDLAINAVLDSPDHMKQLTANYREII